MALLKMTSLNSKGILRKKFLKLLRSQKEEDRLKKSRVILDRLFSTMEFKDAKTILFYASFDGEVDTFEMMMQAQKLGKKIALPAVIRNPKHQKSMLPVLIENLDQELQIGSYGIKEPKKNLGRLVLGKINLILVPGLAFDKFHNRLGRGQGYYDRFLGEVPSSIPAFGLAFDFQIVDHLPHQEKHDVRVSRVISN